MLTMQRQIERIHPSSIPIVFAAGDAFFINTAVGLQSLLCDISQENDDDVAVLASDMARGHGAMLHDRR